MSGPGRQDNEILRYHSGSRMIWGRPATLLYISTLVIGMLRGAVSVPAAARPCTQATASSAKTQTLWSHVSRQVWPS